MMNLKNNIHSRYVSILNKTVPYLLSFPPSRESFNLSFGDFKIEKEHLYSCIDSKKAHFFDLLQSLDQLSFGPVGMPMDKWVFFDCGEMPGGIFGFGLYPKDLDEEILNSFKVEKGYNGLVPISMYIAIPMAPAGLWFGHNLSSVNKLLSKKYDMSGLGILTKAVALKVFNIKKLYGATQWDSSSLNIHLQLANMDLMSSYTPAHSFPYTMTYLSHYDDESLISALSGEARVAKNYDFLIESKDEIAIRNLQEEIEKGAKYTICGRPIYKENKVFFPVRNL